MPLTDHFQWWRWVTGADWRHPEGPDSSIDERGRHPVVHLAWPEMVAFAAWAGGDIPTEAEWEYAARGGLDGAQFAWGEDDPQNGPTPVANTWQGHFPCQNTAVDGWVTTSPVGTYPANGYGLYDVTGNTWEWTSDYFVRGAAATASCCTAARAEASYDPAMPELRIPRRLIKGGSHLCTTQYCFRYRPAARQPQAEDTGTSHVGLRLVYRTPA